MSEETKRGEVLMEESVDFFPLSEAMAKQTRAKDMVLMFKDLKLLTKNFMI
jgi:hypothetical protein